MEYKSIDEIYSANARICDRLIETVSRISDEELKACPEGEKWSVEQIFEHVSIVDEGMARICRKLLTEAEKSSLKSSEIVISDVFKTYTDSVDEMKLEAPETVWPTGQQSVEGSKEKLGESRAMFASLRPLFDEFDDVSLKLPHPYFGPL